jgi:hypothetical protein
MKKIIILAIASILLWFPICFSLATMADVAGVPDTEAWLWVLRVLAAVIAACVGWMIVDAQYARKVSLAAFGVIAIISNILLVLCVILGALAVVMIFVKNADWVYEHLYHPILASAVTIVLISVLPLTVLFMIFRATRALGGIVLYLLTFFLGFSLWFYALMIAGSHGLGWVIGGVLLCGIGVIFTAVIASITWGQWTVAGWISLATVLIWIANTLGMAVAENQLKRDVEAFVEKEDDSPQE